MKTIFFTTTLLLTLSSFAQTTKDLKVDHMLRGHIYAQSSITDSSALGGYGESYNTPKKITGDEQFSERGFFLKIDTSTNIPFTEKYNGYSLYLVNKTDSTLKLSAQDSRLNVVAEVFYEGKWQPIEYLPSSWCGNSYHTVFLSQNEYWTFSIPKFTGKIETKLRYSLALGNGKYIYSNEIQTQINKEQLTIKEGHKPNGLMDPYDE
ncbi:MAG: hypothetical protein M3R17_06095 [Bacteroidota bacterium]|nr:hypothetical protein [Bacteroidota bacterium]